MGLAVADRDPGQASRSKGRRLLRADNSRHSLANRGGHSRPARDSLLFPGLRQRDPACLLADVEADAGVVRLW